MLLAAEGGGFFSSSASGYSEGLTLLLLGGQKTKDKPMKITPWNHYPSEEERQRGGGPASEIRLAPPAPESKGLVRGGGGGGCASFSCFRCASTSHNATKDQEILHETPSPQDQKNSVNNPVHDSEEKIVGVGSSLNRSVNGAPADNCPENFTGDVIENSVGGNRELNESLNISESENSGKQCRSISTNGELLEKDVTNQVQRRKVQWMDAIGGELFEIREFEMSDDSDDEFGHGNGKCVCVIM